MWHLLLLAAVAGSTGFATKLFLTPKIAADENENADLCLPSDFSVRDSESGIASPTQHRDGVVFTFSSAQSLTQDAPRSRPKSKNPPRHSKSGIRVTNFEEPEQRNGGKRLNFCLKRNVVKNVAATKASFCSSRDNSLFGWGLSFGIICMMSAGKAEINRLNKTMEETVKLVQELKSEISRRKSSRGHKKLDSVGNIDSNACKVSGMREVMLNKTNSELRDTDVEIWSPGVNDSGGCGSSALTEEPEPQVLEMDQLEAELEFELQKLSGHTADSPCQEEIKSKLDELEAPYEGYHETARKSHGVSASQLHQKLSQLLIKQQEDQIMDLESELQLAQSKLHEKETELQALKNCVKHLTELSLSTVSGMIISRIMIHVSSSQSPHRLACMLVDNILVVPLRPFLNGHDEFICAGVTFLISIFYHFYIKTSPCHFILKFLLLFNYFCITRFISGIFFSDYINCYVDDETQTLTCTKGTNDWCNNIMDSKSKHSIVGTKRPIDSESLRTHNHISI